MFVVYEVCSGWSEESFRFVELADAEECALRAWEYWGTEHKVRKES